MRTLARHAVHVSAAFAVTLIGMLLAKRQPVTLDLVLSTLPAAAVATLRALEARTAAQRRGEGRNRGAAQPDT